MYRKPSLLIWFAAIATMSVGALRMDAQDRQPETRRFRLGQQVGDCLLKGCSAVVAAIESVGPPEKEPTEPDPERAVMFRKVTLMVRERLHGSENRDSIQVLAATRPQFSKTNQGPWNAWEGVNVGVGANLLLVLWPDNASRPEWHGMPEDVALAVSDQGRIDAIRAAIEQHHRFQQEPGAIWAGVRLFQEQTKADPLVKGYVLTYLMTAASVDHLEATAKVLAAFLADPGVPDEGRPQIADWLASSFYRLEDPARKAVTELVVASAGADDPVMADAALTVLVRLSDLEMLDMKAFLTPPRQQKIAANYRAFQARTKGAGHARFESQLGAR